MPRASGRPDPAVRPHDRAVLVTLAVLVAGYSTMQSLVIPALPAIQRTLGLSPTTTSWTLTAFLLSASVATPLAGRLGDLRGKRPVLVAVLACVLAGTAICAAVPSAAGLLTGRFLQGIGGGAMPLAYAIVRDELAPARVPQGIALMSSLLGVGGAIGVLAAGLIVQVASYAWLFWLQLPLFAAVAWAVHRWIPDRGRTARTAIDWSGAALMSGGLLLLLLAITQAERWGVGSPATLAVAGGAVGMSVAWWRSAQRRADPIVDLRLLRERASWTVNLAALLIGAAQFSAFVMLPQFVQEPTSTGYGLAATPLGSAIFLLPMTVAMVVLGAVAGRIERRIGLRGVLLSGVAAAIGAFALLVMARTAPWELYLASALLGTGLSLGIAGVTTLAVVAVSPDRTGVAAGINNVARTIGGAIGGQLAAVLLAGAGRVGGGPAAGGYSVAFSVGLVAVVAVVLLAPLLPGGRGPAAARPEPVA